MVRGGDDCGECVPRLVRVRRSLRHCDMGCGMTADGWLTEPNGEGWYWIEGYVSAGPKYIRHLGRDWYWMGADQAIALGKRRVYPVIDVPKEIEQ